MSEKRFNCVLGKDYHIINDNVDNMTYFLQERNDVVKLVGVLNEQQSDLIYLARFIGEFKVEEFKLKLRNLRILEDKIDEQQSTIEAKNEYQRTLEAKIRRLKDRIKVLERNG